MVNKVLLADDSATIQKLVEMALSDSDFELLAVSDGKQAVDKIADFQPDIILADAIMPLMDGYQVCEIVKNDPRFRHIPVILLTGRFQPFDKERADQVAVDEKVVKPFSQNQLVSVMRSLIQQSSPPVADDGQTAPTPPPVVGGKFDEGATLITDPELLRAQINSFNESSKEEAPPEAAPEEAAADEGPEEPLDFDSPPGEELDFSEESSDTEEPMELLEEDESEVADEQPEPAADDAEADGEGSEELLTDELEPLEEEGIAEQPSEPLEEAGFSSSDTQPIQALSDEPEDVLKEPEGLDFDDELTLDEIDGSLEPPSSSEMELLEEELELSDESIEELDESDLTAVDEDNEDTQPIAPPRADSGISFDSAGETEPTDSQDSEETAAAPAEVHEETDPEAAEDTSSSEPDTDLPEEETPETVPMDLEAQEPADGEDLLSVESEDAEDSEALVSEDLEETEDLGEPEELTADDFQLELDEPEKEEPESDASLAMALEETAEIPNTPDFSDLDQEESSEPEPETDAQVEPALNVSEDSFAEQGSILEETEDLSEVKTEELDSDLLDITDSGDDLPEVSSEPSLFEEGEVDILETANEAEPEQDEPQPEPEPEPPSSTTGPLVLTDQQMEQISDMVAEKIVKSLGQEEIREIVWQVVPELSEAMIKKRIYQLERAVDET